MTFVIRSFWLVAAVFLLMACESREEKAFYAKFDAVSVGERETDILKRLGPPEYAGAEFKLSQRAGYEKQYADAARSGSVRYHSWQTGIDVTCTVGIDSDSRVAFKACGGT
jgi:hypothetical protein